jgi:hypothetical protein
MLKNIWTWLKTDGLHFASRHLLWIAGLILGLYFLKFAQDITDMAVITLVFGSLYIGLCDLGLYSISKLKLTLTNDLGDKLIIAAIVIGIALICSGIINGMYNHQANKQVFQQLNEKMVKDTVSIE